MNDDRDSALSKRMEASSISFLSRMGPLLLLAWIFFLNILARLILSPMMPTIEKDLQIGHGEAGFFFFTLYLGYCMMLLGSGFVSSWLTHRRTIILSSMAIGGALFVIGLSRHIWGIRIGLITLGMAAGLYLPSGIATVTGLVRSKDLGKAIAVHEIAPNLSSIVAPLITEFLLLKGCSWQNILILLGVVCFFSGILFFRFGRGAASHGETPNIAAFRTIGAEPSFWIMILLFSLGIGSTSGVYSMLPLYLVSERGIDRELANTFVGLSRVFPGVITFAAGWATDRLGPKQTLKVILLATGVITVLLGEVSGPWTVLIIFLQPMLACSFGPPGFAILSRIGDSKFKNVAVSMTLPVSFLLGQGVIPAGMGLMGERSSFSLGFVILGGLLLGGTMLVQNLKIGDESI